MGSLVGRGAREFDECALCERWLPLARLANPIRHVAVRRQRNVWGAPLRESDARWDDAAVRRVCGPCAAILRNGPSEDSRPAGDGWVRSLVRAGVVHG